MLQRRGGAVRIGRDAYKPEHGHYARLLDEDVHTAGVKVRPDTMRWQAAVEAHAHAHRLDAVVETALASPEEIRRFADQARRSPRRLEVIALATPRATCELAALVRFLREAADSGGRYVSWDNQEACTSGLLRTLAVIEDEHLVDRITVLRRAPHQRTSRQHLPHTPGAGQAVKSEYARPWSARETIVFRKELERAGQLLHGEPLPADKRLAVQRDSERAAALAEPVRRIAQPTAAPPGVTYHRLSADEHQGIFEDLIAPAYLARTTKRADPRAVYVLGQPGAGKSEATRTYDRA